MLACQASTSLAGYLLNFSGAVLDAGAVTHPSMGLLGYETFAWTMAAYDVLGNRSAYASPWSFTIEPQRLYTCRWW